MAYITQTQCEASIGVARVRAIYDDNNDGFADGAPLNENIKLACGMVDGALARAYPGPFPFTQAPVPAVVEQAALMWFKALSFERHAEYARADAGRARLAAEKLCESIADGTIYLPDYAASPKPKVVGGLVFDPNRTVRTICDGEDGTFNGGDL